MCVQMSISCPCLLVVVLRNVDVVMALFREAIFVRLKYERKVFTLPSCRRSKYVCVFTKYAKVKFEELKKNRVVVVPSTVQYPFQ